MRPLAAALRHLCITLVACAWGLAAWAGEAGSESSGRLSSLAYARLAHTLAGETSVPLDREFRPAELLAGRLTVIRRDAGAEETENEFLFWRTAGGLESARGPLAPEVAHALAGVPAAAVPVLGLQRCGDSEDYLSVELHLLVEGRPPLRLRADSRCRHLLPWHLTDGRRLAVLTRAPAAEALSALVAALCPACLPPLSGEPPLPPPTAGSDFADHYAALRAEWRRLSGLGATEIELQTQPLADALDWMDHERFQGRLQDTARGKGTDAAMAGRMLRVVQAGRWGYIDRSGRFVLPRRFEKAGAFGGGSALVRDAGLWRLIDRGGRDALDARTGEPVYQAVRLQPRESDGRWGYVDAAGGWAIAPRFDDARGFSEGLAAVNRDGLWGYIDNGGRFVIPPRFLDAGDFGEGLAPVR